MADTLYRIETAEGTLEYRLAPALARLGAWLLDQALIWAIVVGAQLGLGWLGALGSFGRELGGALHYLVLFGAQWLYFVALEWRLGGQTVGKRALGLRVLDRHGGPPTLYQALLRNLLRPVDFLPVGYLLGGLVVMLDRHQRRLGDLVAGSIVVVEESATRVERLKAIDLRYNSLAHDPRARRAARGLLTPHEIEVMVELLDRRDLLPLDLRRELFDELSRHLERRLAIERPAFLSPETYVLGVAALALER